MWFEFLGGPASLRLCTAQQPTQDARDRLYKRACYEKDRRNPSLALAA